MRLTRPARFLAGFVLGGALAAGVAVGILVARDDGDSKTVSPASPPQVAATPSATPSATKEGCEAKPALGPPGPIALADRNGPYYHQVAVGRRDGLTIADAHQVLDHASVPDGVKLADGSIRIYYINAAEDGLWVARYMDGVATPIGPISVDGVSRPRGAVDPDAGLLPDGKVRLAYFGSFGPPGQAGVGGYVMCIADSTDGVNFTLVSRAIRYDEISTDPSLVRFSDGSWLMSASQGQRTALSRSQDGLTFTPLLTVDYGGVAELSLLPNDGVRMYACAQGGMVAWTSGDRGATWQREGQVRIPNLGKKIVCDPSVVAGTDLFVYKTGD